jgi:hypothetical protein
MVLPHVVLACPRGSRTTVLSPRSMQPRRCSTISRWWGAAVYPKTYSPKAKTSSRDSNLVASLRTCCQPSFDNSSSCKLNEPSEVVWSKSAS